MTNDNEIKPPSDTVDIFGGQPPRRQKNRPQ